MENKHSYMKIYGSSGQYD